jgi:hypothetical protein
MHPSVARTLPPPAHTAQRERSPPALRRFWRSADRTRAALAASLVLFGAGRLRGEDAVAAPGDAPPPAPVVTTPPPLQPAPTSAAGTAPAPLVRYRNGRTRHEDAGPGGIDDGTLLFAMGSFSPEIDAITYVDRDRKTTSADAYGHRYGFALTAMDLIAPGESTSPYLSLSLEMDYRTAETSDHRTISELNPCLGFGLGMLQNLGEDLAIYGGPRFGIGYVLISDQRLAGDTPYQVSVDGTTLKVGLDAGLIVDCGGLMLIGQAGYEVKITGAHFGDSSHDLGTADYITRGFVFAFGIGGAF